MLREIEGFFDLLLLLAGAHKKARRAEKDGLRLPQPRAPQDRHLHPLRGPRPSPGRSEGNCLDTTSGAYPLRTLKTPPSEVGTTSPMGGSDTRRTGYGVKKRQSVRPAPTSEGGVPEAAYLLLAGGFRSSSVIVHAIDVGLDALPSTRRRRPPLVHASPALPEQRDGLLRAGGLRRAGRRFAASRVACAGMHTLPRGRRGAR